MNKVKKSLIFLMTAAMALSSVACGKKGGDTAITTPDNVVHYVENTLHDVNVSDSAVPFVVNQQTNYAIYVDVSDASLKSAITKSANFVSEQITSATGATIDVIFEKPVDLTENSYAIVYGYRDLFNEMGLTMPDKDIAFSGYHIKTKGNVVFIQANGGDGYRMGGLAFLRAVLGYDMLSEDCVVYTKDGSVMPAMDITEKPDFDYRQIQNYYSNIEVYGMGMHTHTDLWIPINGWDMHNSLYYIPPEIYGTEHPDWYRADRTQPCYTAHGNKGEYTLMIETVFDVIKKRMQECPTIENISFTAMDGTGQDACTCETCLEYKDLYGTPAATCIYFMNDLNKLVQDYIAENEPGRILNLAFFAYHDSEPAPVERMKYTDAQGNVIWGDALTDENGEYMPLKRYAQDENGQFIKDENNAYVYEVDENGDYVYLKCDEHVCPWLAPIYSKYTASFYGEKNKTYAQNVSLWYTVSENVYIWLYGTNFKYYLYPYNSWSVVTETYRYLKECGVKYVWTQAQERNQSTAFADLKDYIDSKFLFDVNADYGQVIDDYFHRYYKEAAEPMRELFELEQAQCAYLEQTVQTISGGIYDEVGDAKYWPRLLMEEMTKLIDKAYAAVAHYKNTDPKLYVNLVKRIKKESIFPRYVLCMYYGDYYANIREMRVQFRDDWNALGFSVFRETDGDMQTVFTNGWGL